MSLVVLTIRGVSFELVTTPYGPPALQALAETVRHAKGGEPLAPVTVIVPANHVGVTARRLLAKGAGQPPTTRAKGTIGVTFLTVHRLAELLGGPHLAAAGRRPVSTPVITAALRSALHADPGVFQPVASHPATEEALVGVYRELAGIPEPALERLAATSPRAGDVARLCRAARARLASRWHDEFDLLQAARHSLRTGSAAAPIGLGHLIVYLPQDLSQQAALLLRDAAESCPATMIAGLCGHGGADRDVWRSLTRLGIERNASTASPRQLGLFDIAPEPAWPVHRSVTRFITTSDADEEVRVAVRQVIDAARAGTPLERMAILFPTTQPYARLVHEQLAAAGLRFNGTAVRTLKERGLGRTLSNLLALRDRDYRRRDVVGLLTNAPLRAGDGLVPPTAEWERLSREAAVVAGREQWEGRLHDLAAAFERRAERVDHDGDTDEERRAARKAGLLRRAERVHELRDLVLRLIDSLEEAAAGRRPWRSRVQWLRRLAGELIGGETARQRWPDDERKPAERVEAALDRVAMLDQIDEPCTLEVFRRTLALELDADLGRVGRLGEGVLAAPLSYAIGLDLDLVIVLGAAEGTLPARLADDALLPDHERAAALGHLALRSEHLGRQQRQLHAALASAQRHVLCAPRGDLRANHDRTISRWLGEMRLLAEGIDAEEVPSFAHGVLHVRFPATEQEYRLRAGDQAPEELALTAGRMLLAARNSDRFTRYDGNLTGLAHGSLDDRLHDGIVSPTRLETWAECPHAYFMRYILGVDPVDDPGEQLWISPIDKGSLVHEVLERFLSSVLARPHHQLPAPDQPWTPDDHALLRSIAEDVCDEYEARGIVGRDLFWQRDRHRIVARLDRFLREDDDQRRLNRSTPVAAELGFGVPGADLPPIEVAIPGGRTVRFRGVADRIDRSDDGTLRVIDYKTGRRRDYQALSEDNPDDRGTRLQLPVYGLAARAHQAEPSAEVRAEYWFINDRDRLEPAGYAVTDDVLQRVGRTLAIIVDGITTGVFPARPTATSSDPFVRCRYCDPEGLGVADRRRQWERKRLDDPLQAYTSLAEPVEEMAT